jgi:hypothetical protein
MLALGTSLSLIAPDGELLSTVRLRKQTLHHEEESAGTGEAGILLHPRSPHTYAHGPSIPTTIALPSHYHSRTTTLPSHYPPTLALTYQQDSQEVLNPAKSGPSHHPH